MLFSEGIIVCSKLQGRVLSGLAASLNQLCQNQLGKLTKINNLSHVVASIDGLKQLKIFQKEGNELL